MRRSYPGAKGKNALVGFAESQRVLRRCIDAVEAAFDAPNVDLGVGFETSWQSNTRVDLGCYVCSWTVTMPKENL